MDKRVICFSKVTPSKLKIHGFFSMTLGKTNNHFYILPILFLLLKTFVIKVFPTQKVLGHTFFKSNNVKIKKYTKLCLEVETVFCIQ